MKICLYATPLELILSKMLEKKGSAPTVSGRFYRNSAHTAPHRLARPVVNATRSTTGAAAHKTEKFSIP